MAQIPKMTGADYTSETLCRMNYRKDAAIYRTCKFYRLSGKMPRCTILPFFDMFLETDQGCCDNYKINEQI